ncbi:hypothetical protein Clacol_000608 [Clathrus columnatus]|uniref:SMP-30/Gluconolactonase/LRE-like region domain-containing protein n=1 Tax=Clathrus columnatus TaxID=1419009 RepID=A0AAV4ZZ55_9AGAM|nr:hypothetical protein Clacol_000608 [Clathrus columnatus]
MPNEKCPPDGGSSDCVRDSPVSSSFPLCPISGHFSVNRSRENSIYLLTPESVSSEPASSVESLSLPSPMVSIPIPTRNVSLAPPHALITPPYTPEDIDIGGSFGSISAKQSSSALDFLTTLFPRSGLSALPYAKSVSISSPGLKAEWEGIVLDLPTDRRTLYVHGKGAEHVDLRESIVALMDLADEHLHCEAFVIALEKGSSMLGELLHALMYVGGTVVTKSPLEVDPSYILIVGLNNGHCNGIPGLEACEKLIQPRESGIIYLACSNPIHRTFWEPGTGRLNATGRSLTDYIATYDPSTSRITRLALTNFPFIEPLSLQGFDVVTSETNSSELLLFLINHRPPTKAPAITAGADSVIEIFKTLEGSSTMEYIKTIYNPNVIITPSDIVGSGNGDFYFTNNARSKTGMVRSSDALFRFKSKSIGYCPYDDQNQCKIVASGLSGASGIIRGPDDIFYVTNNEFGEILLLEQFDDNSLGLIDVIPTEMPMDKLSVDEKGHIYIAAFPKRIQAIRETLNNPSIPSASAVFRLTKNTGHDQFYGKKYNIDKVFQDDGKISSLTTTAVYDQKHGVLYMSGITSKDVPSKNDTVFLTGSRSSVFTICQIPNA